MGYTIYYHKDKKRHETDCRALIPISVLLVILAITNGFYYFTGCFTEVREQLLPWTRPEIKEAFSLFSENLADGRYFWDCVEDFCLEILDENTEGT